MKYHSISEDESMSEISYSYHSSIHSHRHVEEMDLEEQINLARSSETSLSCFKSLSESKSFSVKEALLENPALPTEVLYDLARDENPDVRYLIASDPYVPGGILRDLSCDENPYISVRAMQTIDRIKLEVSLRRSYRDCLVYLKQHPLGMAG